MSMKLNGEGGTLPNKLLQGNYGFIGTEVGELYRFGKKEKGFVPIWEEGDLQKGEEIESSTRIRTKNFFKCKSNTKYKIERHFTSWLIMNFYDKEKTFITSFGINVLSREFTTNKNWEYIRFVHWSKNIDMFKIEEI